MIGIIKNSYKFEQELDYMEAKKCFNSAMENLPAFVETIQFIFDRCNGRQTEISEKTIDDAFAYIIDKRSYWCPLNFFLCIKNFSGHQYNFVSFPLRLPNIRIRSSTPTQGFRTFHCSLHFTIFNKFGYPFLMA